MSRSGRPRASQRQSLPQRQRHRSYEGLVTRAIAFTVDAALINLVALIVSVSAGLALSVLRPLEHVEKVALAVGGVRTCCGRSATS